MAEIPWICPKGKPSLVGEKRSSPLEDTSLPCNKSKAISKRARADDSIPQPNCVVSQKPLAAMMATWKRFIAEEEATPTVQGCVEEADGKGKEDSPSKRKEDSPNKGKEDSPLPMTSDSLETPDSLETDIFFPLDMFGETWDQCVAAAEEKFQAEEQLRELLNNRGSDN